MSESRSTGVIETTDNGVPSVAQRRESMIYLRAALGFCYNAGISIATRTDGNKIIYLLTFPVDDDLALMEVSSTQNPV